MRDDRWAPYGAASGAAAVALFVIGNLVAGSQPDFDASAQEIAQEIADNRTRIQIGTALFGLASALFVWFLATVHSLTRPGPPGARRAGTLAFGCGVAAIALFLADNTAYAVAALRPENVETAPELATALHDFSLIAFGVGAFVFAGVYAAFAVLVLRDRALWPDWLGWAAAATALLLALRVGTIFTTSGAFAGDGALGFYTPVAAFAVWTLLGSLVLAREVARTPEPSGMFGGVSGRLGRVRETLPRGGPG
jgi:hypothetical protein